MNQMLNIRMNNPNSLLPTDSIEIDGIPKWVKDEELIPTIIRIANSLNIECQPSDIHGT